MSGNPCSWPRYFTYVIHDLESFDCLHTWVTFAKWGKKWQFNQLITGHARNTAWCHLYLKLLRHKQFKWQIWLNLCKNFGNAFTAIEQPAEWRVLHAEMNAGKGKRSNWYKMYSDGPQHAKSPNSTCQDILKTWSEDVHNGKKPLLHSWSLTTITCTFCTKIWSKKLVEERFCILPGRWSKTKPTILWPAFKNVQTAWVDQLHFHCPRKTISTAPSSTKQRAWESSLTNFSLEGKLTSDPVQLNAPQLVFWNWKIRPTDCEM